jgi:hypothetical protein
MKRDELVSAVKDLAMRTNANVGEANWYLFGSALKGLSDASDIDLEHFQAWWNQKGLPKRG